MLKAVLISGSPRKDGNTEIILSKCAKKLAESEIQTKLINLSAANILPCTACMYCKKGKPECSIKKDDFSNIFSSIIESDIVILGSPVYFGSATAQIKALIDRVGYVSRGNGGLLSKKIGAPIVVARRAGQNFTYAQLLYWYTINDMIIPGSTYWNIGFARDKGEIENDTECIETIEKFAENIIFLAKKIKVKL